MYKISQKKLMESLMAADKWRTAFKDVAALVGFPFAPGREPDTQVRISECIDVAKTS